MGLLSWEILKDMIISIFVPKDMSDYAFLEVEFHVQNILHTGIIPLGNYDFPFICS